MLTATVEVEAPERAHPLMVTGLVTAAPASGMLTSVPEVALQAAGAVVGGAVVGGAVVGGMVPDPVCSSRFGEPDPRLVISPEVASAIIAAATWAGVNPGLAARI